MNVSKPSDRTNYIDGLLLTTESFERFPAEIIWSIVCRKHDIGLLNLASISSQYMSIAREVFAKRYADKSFVIDAKTEKHHKLYSEFVSHFGAVIKSIEVNDIRNIDENHWTVQLLTNHTPNLEKISFKRCSFTNIDGFLSQHINITHLEFRGGACENRYRIQLPEYHNLKSLEIVNFPHYSKSSLEQVLVSNPQMERLILKYNARYFTLSDFMAIIHQHLKRLKVLNLVHSCNWDSIDASLVISLDEFVSGLKHLESFGMTIYRESEKGLLRRVISKCENVKHFELNIYLGYYISRELHDLIQLICSMDTIETLSLINLSLQEQLEMIVESLPNLRCLTISNVTHRTNSEILALLRKSSKNLEKLVIESQQPEHNVEDVSIYRKNFHFHREFMKAIPIPEIKLELKENDEVIGLVTKDEIVYRNKLLHWVGYDPTYSRSDLQLLDLATVPKGSTGLHKQPLNLILNYLDLDSLYSFSKTSKDITQLVHKYTQQRCRQSAKKCTKSRSIDDHKFYITDEFGINYNGLRMFRACIRYLDVNLFDFNGYHNLLNEIEKHCKLLKKLCFRTRHRIDPESFSLPQVRHFIFYGYGLSEEYIFHCNLRNLSRKCPHLEIFEIRTKIRLCGNGDGKKISFQNLKKIKFKPFDEASVEYAKNVFKDACTEVIVDHCSERIKKPPPS